ncbi:hypothetical protein [Tenacibaculum aquimarinum]|uniref:hypothetical protein n=1 Tax=Tenacibaculum aquimarinum TaxID=2910675 RepID=UPI001F0AC344|nr:hypothetical protein [Tenacibaculum aquimarinum]MCH3885847.1 hypothetical protein [Tenacibaculum aquimarinum]
MKLHYANTKLPLYMLSFLMLTTLISCGTAQTVTNSEDGIYADSNSETEGRRVILADQKEYREYNDNYFTKELQRLDELNGSDIITDIDSYKSYGNEDEDYEEEIYEDDSQSRITYNEPWGYDNADVVVNINTYPRGNIFYYDSWNTNYWGHSSYNWRWRFRNSWAPTWGYNSWHPYHYGGYWNTGFYGGGFAYYGNPYYSPFRYGNYYRNTRRGANSYRGRYSVASNSRRGYTNNRRANTTTRNTRSTRNGRTVNSTRSKRTIRKYNSNGKIRSTRSTRNTRDVKPSKRVRNTRTNRTGGVKNTRNTKSTRNVRSTTPTRSTKKYSQNSKSTRSSRSYTPSRSSSSRNASSSSSRSSSSRSSGSRSSSSRSSSRK